MGPQSEVLPCASVRRLIVEREPHHGKSLNVFLCHSSGDKPVVRDLYRRLRSDGFKPWLDEESLLPGQEWDQEISKVVRDSDVVIVCLSPASITKKGYVQKEIKVALDVADEQPEGTIFIIPLKLEDCGVPGRLSRWHWVELYKEDGYKKLVKALELRAANLNIQASPAFDTPPTTQLHALHIGKSGSAGEEKDVTQRTLSPLTYAIGSVMCLLTAIGLLILFINRAQELVQTGIDENAFYVLLALLGLSYSIFVLSVVRSYAKYHNIHIPKALTLSGSIVGGIVIILGGILISVTLNSSTSETPPLNPTNSLTNSAMAPAASSSPQARTSKRPNNQSVKGGSNNKKGVRQNNDDSPIVIDQANSNE